MDLLKPKELHITDNDGVQRTYTISRMPFMVAREVGIQYGGSILPKVGDYRLNEAMMLKMMNYVAVDVQGKPLRLATPQLIDNHVPDLDTGLQLEWAMMEYNAGFFHKGTISDFFGDIVRKTLAKDFRNIDPIAGCIIDADKATLHELRTVYDLEDGFILWECVVIPRFNAWQRSKKKK